MNWDQIEGKREEMSGKVQAQWGKLCKYDLDVIKGRNELESRLQRYYGYAAQKAKSEVDAWLASGWILMTSPLVGHTSKAPWHNRVRSDVS